MHALPGSKTLPDHCLNDKGLLSIKQSYSLFVRDTGANSSKNPEANFCGEVGKIVVFHQEKVLLLCEMSVFVTLSFGVEAG